MPHLSRQTRSTFITSNSQHHGAHASSSLRRSPFLLLAPLALTLSACAPTNPADMAPSGNAAPSGAGVSSSAAPFRDEASSVESTAPASGNRTPGAKSKAQSGRQAPAARAPHAAEDPSHLSDGPTPSEQATTGRASTPNPPSAASPLHHTPPATSHAGTQTGSGNAEGATGSANASGSAATGSDQGAPATPAGGPPPAQNPATPAPAQPGAPAEAGASPNGQPKNEAPAATPGEGQALSATDSQPGPTPRNDSHGARGIPSVVAAPSLDEFVDRENLRSARTSGALPVVATLKEATQLKGAPDNVVLSSGGSHVHFERGAADADYTISIAGTQYGATFDTEVPTIAWEGQAASPIQEALKVARKKNLGVRLTAGQTYPVNETLFISKNIPFFDGSDAKLDVAIPGGSHSDPATVFVVEANSADKVVANVDIDLADSPYTRGLIAESVSRLVVSDVDLFNVTYRGFGIYASRGDASDIVIEGCTVDNVDGGFENKGLVESITVSAALDLSQVKNSSSPIWDQYTSHGTVPANVHTLSHVTIANNEVSGGYYGISFSGVSDSLVSGNQVQKNTRSISMQNNTHRNVVEGNTFIDSRSSSVHVAYNSDENLIRKNTVRSQRATGQGLLQAYQDSDSNTFEGNTVTVSGDSEPGWVLYVGTDSDATTFKGNDVSGRARKAMVGIESVWDSTSSASGVRGTNGAAYMSTQPAAPTNGELVNFNGGFGDLSQVTIENNVFTPGDPQAPVFYIGAEVSKGRHGNQRIIGDINALTIKNNTVHGSQYKDMVRKHSGNLPGVGQARIDMNDEAQVNSGAQR
ncbi:MAG: right-handed parallel beta-helix repeat-containing protein [Actinomycetaceae bacterium]|nr:right-handed parallel beta-helix repeat-containing protein [Actinomycetaceae bacterium]